MPSLTQHHSAQTTKIILLGDSGSGKTGALASLADAGYNLRILDLDNGMDVLFNYLTDPTSQYKNGGAARVHYHTLTEKMRSTAAGIFPAKATVWSDALRLLNDWKDDEATPPVSFGNLSTWTSQDVLVIDSLTALSVAAFNFYRQLNGRLAGAPGGNEWRRDIGSSQSLVEGFLQLLADKSVVCNVILISHISYQTAEGEFMSAKDKESGNYSGVEMVGLPSSLGKALAPKIPRYFNTMLSADTIGSGASIRHQIHTVSQGIVAGKTSAPLKVKKVYPLATGLADYFADLRKTA